ncbi:MAG TPA: GxxExxY protein [bacterium]|nr:GxxExxY protein [bacterium]
MESITFSAGRQQIRRRPKGLIKPQANDRGRDAIASVVKPVVDKFRERILSIECMVFRQNDSSIKFTKGTKNLQFDDLSNKIIGGAIEVHRKFGPGLLESAYERCLAREFFLVDIAFKIPKRIPMAYKGLHLDCGCHLDVLVENKKILEIKVIDKLIPIVEAPILTYRQSAKASIGLLINFIVELSKEGIRRFVL